MIKATNSIKGIINTPQNLKGKTNASTVKVYPELEDLTVTSSTEEQHFKSEKYGFDNVTVKAVESEELSIIPSAEEQTKEGLFNKVTVAGDSDLLPENIKEGTEIFGVQGTAELRGEENAIINGHSLSTNTSSNPAYTPTIKSDGLVAVRINNTGSYFVLTVPNVSSSVAFLISFTKLSLYLAPSFASVFT